jgi:S1-C subfamily serine protease
MIWTRRKTAGGALKFAALVGAAAAWAATAPAAAPQDDVRRDAAVIAVEKVMPSVVNIATRTIIRRARDPMESLFRQFWDPYYNRQAPNSQYSLGSGVVIDEAGYLLTNDHVVRRADTIEVKFANGTNVYEATVIASDPNSDVALLKLKARPDEKFQAIKFAHEDDLLLGETVLALGNPFGLGGSVSRGILSSKTRNAPKAGERFDIPNWLQTDAPINFGNSGGPLVNLRGELIGINVAVLHDFQGQPAEGIGFAIPIRGVLESLGDIFPTEFVKSYWFGARVKVGTSPLVITSVQAQSPAGKAGLEPGDAILQVNGRRPKSFIDFADLVATNLEAEVKLAVLHNNERKDIKMKLVAERTVFNGETISERMGLKLELVTPKTAAQYGFGGVTGFLITGVEDKGPASAAGLGRGVLITGIDGQLPPDLTALAKRIYFKQKGERIQLDVAVQQRMGNFNVLSRGAVELAAR